MSATSGSGWSILGTASRFRAPPRGMLFGSPGNPRPIIRARPSVAQQEAIRERTKPVIARLNQQRQAWFDATEQQLRLKMGAAAAAGLVLGWLFMGSLPVGLALMVGGAFFAFLMLSAQADDTARAETKHAILDVMAQEILGLTSVAPDKRAAALPQSRVEHWRLLPPIRVLTVDDRFTGVKEGCQVAISRLGFQFGGRATAHLRQGDGLVFVVVEITGPDAGKADTGSDIAVVLGTDAPLVLGNAPRLFHGLTETGTGDDAFDNRYKVFGDPSLVTPQIRSGFRALEAVTRCDKTGTREVPAGTGLRPAVVIGPGRLVVLTPAAVFDGALEPPPFWQPLVPETLIPAFASDLAMLDDYLTAAMALRDRFS